MNKLALQQFSKQYVIQQKRVEEAVNNTFSELPEITSLARICIELRLSEVILQMGKLKQKGVYSTVSLTFSDYFY